MKAKLFLVKPSAPRAARKVAPPTDRFGIAPPSGRAFDEHRAALLGELAPQGALRMAYFERLVHASWILLQCRELETEILAGGLEAIEDDVNARTLDYLGRRTAAAEQVYSRALKGLLAR